MDELFPDTPIEITKVATSFTVGGACVHCGQVLARGRAVHKLAPACCLDHRKPHPHGAKNGPGSWVCTTCAEVLAPRKGGELL